MLELSKTPERQEEEAQAETIASDCSVADMLRLLGTGAGGQILMALGRRPLRTRQLTDRVTGFSARSVYRWAGEMEACGLIDRDQVPGVPSKVVLRLSEPAGRELFRLLRAFAPDSSAQLNLLGELWKLGFLEELSRGPRSLAQLARGGHEMTFHQVNRRIGLFLSSGLLTASPSSGNGKRYELTRDGRRCMALIAGIGRWRRHVLPDGASGLSIAEMATVLRAAMPLTTLPERAGSSINLSVTGAADAHGHRDVQMVPGTVGVDGILRYTPDTEEIAEGTARATINTWFAALLDGNRGRMQVRGDLYFVDSFLTQLYDVLWDAPTCAKPASNGAGAG